MYTTTSLENGRGRNPEAALDHFLARQRGALPLESADIANQPSFRPNYLLRSHCGILAPLPRGHATAQRPGIDGDVVADHAAASDLRFRADGDATCKDRFVDDRTGTDANALPEHRLAYDGVGADAAALAEHDVWADRRAGIDDDVAIGVHRRHYTGMSFECVAAISGETGLDEQRPVATALQRR